MNHLNLKIIVLGLAVVMIVTPKMHGSAALPYLPLVGPPPLRFAAIAPQSALFLAELALPKPKMTPQPPMPSPSSMTNSAVTEIATGVGPTFPVPGKNGAPILDGSANNALAPGNSASDLLNITPEMVNTYFKPSRRASDVVETNGLLPGDSIFVPAELGFVPPTSSRAIYKSK